LAGEKHEDQDTKQTAAQSLCSGCSFS
jgi:hypothetical protein